MRRIWKKMENMDDSGKEPPTGRTKLAVEPVSKIIKNKPEGCIVFIEHYPPRTSPRVTLPIKEENEDDSPRHGETLSIKEEYGYDDLNEEYVYDDTQEYSIKQEYEYDDSKEYTTNNVEKEIEVTEKKGEKDNEQRKQTDNKGIDEENNITTRAEEGNLVEKLTLDQVEKIQGRFYDWLNCQMCHNTLDSNGHLIVCTCFPEMPRHEYIFGEGYKEFFKGREHLDDQGKLYKKWRKRCGFEDD